MPSSVIAAFHYIKETSTLRVVFVSGTIYDYLDVPEAVYKKMKQVTSKGTFLNTTIKGRYYFQKVQ